MLVWVEGLVAYGCRDNGRMPGVFGKLGGGWVGLNVSDWSSVEVKDIAMRTHADRVKVARAKRVQ
jgi:hypothetical protein